MHKVTVAPYEKYYHRNSKPKKLGNFWDVCDLLEYFAYSSNKSTNDGDLNYVILLKEATVKNVNKFAIV
jgi:hypothetical protein